VENSSTLPKKRDKSFSFTSALGQATRTLKPWVKAHECNYLHYANSHNTSFQKSRTILLCDTKTRFLVWKKHHLHDCQQSKFSSIGRGGINYEIVYPRPGNLAKATPAHHTFYFRI